MIDGYEVHYLKQEKPVSWTKFKDVDCLQNGNCKELIEPNSKALLTDKEKGIGESYWLNLNI